MFAITTIALAVPAGRLVEMQACDHRFYSEQRQQWIRQRSNTIEAELTVPITVAMWPLNK